MTIATDSDRYGDTAMAAPAPAGRTDDTRQALLDAAHDLLASEGPGALTVRRIAAAAGMSTMNVYSRFGGKQGVLDELLTDGFRRLAERMDAGRPSDDPIADLRRCSVTYRQFARDHATYYSLMFDRAVPDFEPSAAARDVALGTLALLAQRVQLAMDAGALAPGDAFEVATALWACQHGLASLEARTPPELDAFDWDAVAALTVEALLRGLASPTPNRRRVR